MEPNCNDKKKGSGLHLHESRRTSQQYCTEGLEVGPHLFHHYDNEKKFPPRSSI